MMKGSLKAKKNLLAKKGKRNIAAAMISGK
jgi:hypothetical protein